MAEERTVSCFTKLNSSDRSRQKVSTLVHMTRIWQHLLRGHCGPELPPKPVLKFRDLSSSLLRQHTPSNAVVEGTEDLACDAKDLHDGWKVEDIEKPEAGSINAGAGTAEEDDLEDESDDDEYPPEPVDPKALTFDVEIEYGVNLRSPILLDILSDHPIEGAGADLGEDSHRDKSSATTLVISAAKKDVSSVDLECY
ncbi:hypothetical protein BDV93DRAFT_564861 [Ceratobasidium sp. AG-I]|nr:hypothetical protein BDV93DRAFT_564861 [Ceratobasidium sp. AG-I]